ncbi:MAG: hypothetical protein JOZ48_02570 [Acidobacteriaceae bacterium]|nr:hypothetical protein [Acidobacteriaceae bacterium]
MLYEKHWIGNERLPACVWGLNFQNIGHNGLPQGKLCSNLYYTTGTARVRLHDAVRAINEYTIQSAYTGAGSNALRRSQPALRVSIICEESTHRLVFQVKVGDTFEHTMQPL